MTSKHYKWQARWRLDLGAGLATHETGLRVRLRPGAGPPRVAAENRDEITAALAPKHGGHNAPAMVARLEREARQLFQQAQEGPDDARRRHPPISTD